MTTISPMTGHEERIASDLSLSPRQVRDTVRLLEDGATVHAAGRKHA